VHLAKYHSFIILSKKTISSTSRNGQALRWKVRRFGRPSHRQQELGDSGVILLGCRPNGWSREVHETESSIRAYATIVHRVGGPP
jgi:hypothetical protein